MNRLGVGYSRATFLQLRAEAPTWLRQMRPGTVAESDKAKALADWFPDLRDSPARKWEKHISKTRPPGSTPGSSATTR